MKKYSDKHLESVPPEWIAYLEDFLNNKDIDHCYGCPLDEWFECSDVGKKNFPYPSTGSFCLACPTYMAYNPYEGNYCPCDNYSSFRGAKMAGMNLINQWKKWAGIEKGE